MTIRKILSVVLCVIAVLSVMTVAAQAADIPAPVPNDPPATTTAPEKSLGEQILEWWESVKVWLEPLYQFSFQGLSQALVVAVQGFFALIGLNFWQGGIFGFLT